MQVDMKLENQVVSLELAQKMKELGFKQESFFVFVKNRQTAFPDIYPMRIFDAEYHNGKTQPAFHYDIICSAYTVAELGEMLPENFYESMGRTLKGGWCVLLDKDEDTMLYADTEADARAKMLIYLVENKLITI